MKKLFFIVALFLPTLPVISHSVSLPVQQAAARGTATVSELANVVFAALQNNDFEQLPLYVPTDTELSSLQKKSSEDMQAVLQDLTADDVTASLRESFDAVIQAGVDKTLNLAELTLGDVRAGNASSKNKALIPVTATLTTRDNQPLALRFEALKINGRYFLFQRMEWQASK
ncbi:hypothetical protein HUW51_14460 [Adhaeribacter swui]|uniref:DUF3887 domain-containing protein n=1 Tax=Adhaeribacter swui TaxID=2086471 RepID=A0A7G7G9N0_9BACT|nr:hypothetical protein [Adhaeribacter swui]QNF33864.1 hypothetical protein HUW51_14460 [Adhaeribacter swui]